MTSAQYVMLAASALMALHAAPVAAKGKANYVFTELLMPNGDYIYPASVYQNEVVGTADAGGVVWSAGNYTIIPAVEEFDAVSDNGVAIGSAYDPTKSYTTYNLTTGATNTFNFGPSGGNDFSIAGINASGAVVATQYTTVMPKNKRKTACQPFIQYPDGSYSWLAPAAINGYLPGPGGATDSGIVPLEHGTCVIFTGETPGSIYKNGKRKKFTIPGATNIGVRTVAGGGFGGFYVSGGIEYGFTVTGPKSKLTTYAPPPGVSGISVEAMSPNNEPAGNSEDAQGYFHGFIFVNDKYYQIDYPGHKATAIRGFSSTGAIIGFFGDVKDEYPDYPFVATCASDQGCTK